MKDEIKVELLKYPDEKDLMWVKTCTLNTVGKTSTKAPTEEWIKKLVEAEHSPARELWFGIKMTIPYWVSVHFVRHHIGVNHYVMTQRNDRQSNYDRNKAPQGQFVNHIMSVNAQELIFMAHKRLCSQASVETRRVMQMIRDEVIKVAPYMKDVLVPLCEYRNGKCTEMYPCGRAKKSAIETVKNWDYDPIAIENKVDIEPLSENDRKLLNKAIKYWKEEYPKISSGPEVATGFCPHCDEFVVGTVIKRPYATAVKGVPIDGIEIKEAYCPVCGELITSDALEEYNEKVIFERYKDITGHDVKDNSDETESKKTE